MSNKSGTSPQVITLPTGGGAVQGIGETFSPDLFTGTGNFTVPIGVPPGRNGFQPQLSLVHSSGNGSGPFGLGWALSVPSVSRKTSKGVPRYRDPANDASDTDTFVLSGAEDLVPVSRPEPGVTRFRPRTEGLFALIDRVQTNGDDHWRVSSRDGMVSRYGAALPSGADPAVLADPADRGKVFSWKLTDTTDPFGNRIEYNYLRDSGTEGPRTWDQLYPQRVRYVDFDTDGGTRFLVSVTFVYEERPDPISEHRAGFEIRTRLRCRRIEIRTHAGPDLLTHTYELEYLDDLVGRDERPPSDLPLNGVSLLGRVRAIGHDGDRTQELPPLDFGYSRFAPERPRFQPIEAAAGELPPVSLADGDFETVDLFGNGLPDVVQMNGAVLFWRNLGDGRFDRPQEMREVPAGVRLRDPGVQFADMNGDGRADLLVLPQGGYFPLGFEGRWSPEGFVQYPSSPTVAFGADDIRLVDLDGDGVVDALRTGPSFELFFNDPEAGWDRVETRPRRPLEEFPDVSFSDPRVKLADLNGDDLQDIVLVGQGRIDYWPYLGHGNWGHRVRMGSSPVFRDEPPLPEGFDARRVLLGDVDGDGLDDIVYVQADRLTFWINQGGERWSAPVTVDSTPPFTDIDGVRLTDMLGTGMNGVLWTSDPVPGAGSHYQFLDLTGGLKPYLLERMDNHMGAVTNVRYSSSTRFRLADSGAPASRWKTPLPFPVQVVDRVETIDRISGGKLTKEYRYHHGFWDGVEREFRGFGLVEQLDTEAFEDFHADVDSATFTPVSERQFSPPVMSKTWFHQGPVGEEFDDWLEPDRSAEYWPDDPPALGHVESLNAFLAALPQRRLRRDALRALAGSVLRTELYARDGSSLEGRPHTVSELAYGLREESPPDPQDDDRRRVFFPHLVAERVSQWERGSEPMTSFSFTDDYDEFGQPRCHTSLAVPRGRDFRVAVPSGDPYLGTTTSTTYARRDGDNRYIVDRVAGTTTYEILNDGRQPLLVLRDAIRAGTARLAVIGQTLTYYDGPAFKGLPSGRLGEFGAPVRSETLVLTEDILGDDVPPYLRSGGPPPWTDEYPEEFRDLLPSLAGYTFSPGDPERVRGYFLQQSRHRYDFHDDAATGRGLLLESRHPLGRASSIRYDAFGLLPVRATDAAALSAMAVHDYRVLRPRLTTNVNGNRTAFAFTPLGFLERIAVMGKEGEPIGDTLAAPSTRFVYDLLAASAVSPDERQPASVRTIRRVRHVTGAPPSERDDTIETVEYSDGFGRLIQTRVQAENVTFGDSLRGESVLPAQQDDPTTRQEVRGRRNGDPARPNVVVSGWQVYDNKGHVVERYEPFFATGWDFGAVTDAQLGRRVTMFYDPLGRAVRTVNPDGSEKRVVYGIPRDLADPDRFRPAAWEAFTYDTIDNATRTHAGEAARYEHQVNTPSSLVVDALGRPVTTIERTRPPRSAPGVPLPPIQELRSHCTYDIRGNPLVVTDPLGRQAFRYRYDLANRPLRIDSIDGGQQQVIFDAAGHKIERRDGKGALILQAYDILSRPSRLWARDDTSSRVSLRERLEYGDGGDPDQPAAERADARAANLLGTIHRHYDEAGLITVDSCDFKGNVLQRSRRVIGDDPILGVFPAPDDPSPDWRISGFEVDWQPPDGESLQKHADRLLDATTYATSTRYDAMNRVSTMQCPAGTDGGRKEVQLAYDRSGALDQVSLDGDLVVERIAYNANGQRTLIALGNGVMTRYAYDSRTLRLVRMRSEGYTKTTSGTVRYRPTGALLQDLAHRYDLVGNILDIVDRTPGCGVVANPEALSVEDSVLRTLIVQGDALIRSFAYDPLYRLVSATGRECKGDGTAAPWADLPRCGFDSGNHGTPNQDNAPSLTAVYRQAFAYDPVGNLTELTHTSRGSGRSRTFEQLAGTNRLGRMVTGQTAIRYTHDTSGNLVSETTSRHFEWDHSNRMKVFKIQSGTSEPTVHAHYLYGANGARVKKLVRKQGGTVEVATYIDGMFEHHRWSRADEPGAANTNVHVTDGHQRVAVVREGPPHPDDHGPAMQYTVGDHLGSGSLTIEDSGAFVNREEFTPYGETSFGSFGRKRYRFCGKERDEESGQSCHSARYYAPYMARWTSPDPAGQADGSNLYVYCRSNPLVYVDPNGTNSKKLDKVKRQLHNTAYEFESLQDAYPRALEQLGPAEQAAEQAESKLDNLSPDDPRFTSLGGDYDRRGFLSTQDAYQQEVKQARSKLSMAQKRAKDIERRLLEVPGELDRLREKAYRLGLSFEEIVKIQTEGATAWLSDAIEEANRRRSALGEPLILKTPPDEGGGGRGSGGGRGGDPDGGATGGDAPGGRVPGGDVPDGGASSFGKGGTTARRGFWTRLKGSLSRAGRIAAQGARTAGRVARKVAGPVLTALSIKDARDAYHAGKAKHGTGGGILDGVFAFVTGEPGHSDALEASQLIPKVWECAEAGIGPGNSLWAMAVAHGCR
jgi:RHS repeat-associated protein